MSDKTENKNELNLPTRSEVVARNKEVMSKLRHDIKTKLEKVNKDKSEGKYDPIRAVMQKGKTPVSEKKVADGTADR